MELSRVSGYYGVIREKDRYSFLWEEGRKIYLARNRSETLKDRYALHLRCNKKLYKMILNIANCATLVNKCLKALHKYR